MKKLVSLASVFALAGCVMGGDSSPFLGFGGGGVERGDMPQELADRSSSVTGMGLWDNTSSNVVAWLEGLIGDLGGGSSIFGTTRKSSIGQGISQTQMDTFQSTKYNNAVKILKNVLAIYNNDKDASTSKEDLRRAWLVLGAGKESHFESMYNKDGAKDVLYYIRKSGDIKGTIDQFFLVSWDDNSGYYVEDWNPRFQNIENVGFNVLTNETGKDIDKFTFVLDQDVIKAINWDGNLLTRTLDAKGDEYFVSGDNVYAIRYESYGKNLLKYADFGEIILFEDMGGDVLNNRNNLGSELFAGGYDNKRIKIGDFDFERGEHTMNFAGKAIGKVAFYTEDLKTNEKNKTSWDTWYTQNATIAFDSYGNVALKMPFLTQGDGGYDVNVYEGHAEFLDSNGARQYEGVTDNFYVTCYGAGNKPSEAIGQVKVTDVEMSNDGYYKETMNFDAVAGASGGNITDGIIDCQWCSTK